jgi:hypothetical protein
MAPDLPDQLFTSINIASVGIATVAVNVFTNTLYKLAKLPPKWTAFIAALIIAIVVVSISSNHKWYDWVLAFFNACLLFCSALGINEIGAEALSGGSKGFAKPAGFITSWIK